MNTRETVMIIIAARSDRGIAANLVRKEMLRSDLDVLARQGKIRFAPALCFYQGDAEHSFVVVVQDASAIKTVLGLGVYYDQECVLVRDDSGVYLHFMQYLPQPFRAPERILVSCRIRWTEQAGGLHVLQRAGMGSSMKTILWIVLGAAGPLFALACIVQQAGVL